MKFVATTIVSLSLALQALGARLPIKNSNGPVKTDSYIVVLKPTANKQSHLDAVSTVAKPSAKSSYRMTHNYQVLKGYTAHLTGAALEQVLTSSDVAYVEADAIGSIKYDIDEVHDDGEDEDGEYSIQIETDEALYKRAAAGSGVTVYGIDTGIYTAHTAFGGRAAWGATFGGYASNDGNGHGTHTAGTAVGAKYGVATAARIIAIKVLSDQGSGAYSDIISGIDYALKTYQSSGRPGVATMSLGGPNSAALDAAVSNAISKGLHFSIAAGNAATDAKNTSPANVATANTIGAIDGTTNKIASFSNFGAYIDVFAPGVNILSSWIGYKSATATLSGTSMATPYVAGLLAVALGEYGNVSPASLAASLKSHAKANVTGTPAGTTKLRAYKW